MYICVFTVSCLSVHCGVNAVCVEGTCLCLPGHVGDGRAGCRRISFTDAERRLQGKNPSANACCTPEVILTLYDRFFKALNRAAMCSLPLRTGPCYNTSTRYGFFPPAGECVRFAYSGCRGNRNNFITREDCESVCLGTWHPQSMHRANQQSYVTPQF